MDEKLAEIRTLAAKLQTSYDSMTEWTRDIRRLCQATQEMDRDLKAGTVLPREWQRSAVVTLSQ